MKIMVVDDSATFRKAMKHMLGKNGDYQIVAEAENGQIALEMMEIYHPDLILMDIEMPVMNGIEAAKIMLNMNKYVTIIAISGHQESLYLKDIMRAGFKASVYKNNVFDQLEIAIEYAMSGRWYLSV